jgi:RNA polymerase sigma factor for flagellar operon FliA
MPSLIERRSGNATNNRCEAKLPQRFRRIAQGSAAEEEMVRLHLPLVRTVLGRMAMSLPAHADLDDLHSAGLIGLLNAVRNFDPEGGSSFETYARIRIRGAVLDELRRLDWVPRSVHEKARKVQAAIQSLEQEKGEVPTAAEVARALDLSVGQYEQLLDEVRPAAFVCLDSAARSAEDSNEGDRYESIADDSQTNPLDCTARRELTRLVAGRLQQLPEMQRKVLALYYFEDLRLREIAQAFGVTESRICQIHAQAILSIRSFLEKQAAHGLERSGLLAS